MGLMLQFDARGTPHLNGMRSMRPTTRNQNIEVFSSNPSYLRDPWCQPVSASSKAARFTKPVVQDPPDGWPLFLTFSTANRETSMSDAFGIQPF